MDSRGVRCLHTMSSKVRYTSYSIALNLDVGAEHLSDQRFEAAQLNDEQFVIG